MRSKRHWAVVVVGMIAALLVPRESAAGIGWIWELSGPGPFFGPFLFCRTSVPVTAVCDDSFGIGIGALSDQKTVAERPPVWVRLEVGHRWERRKPDNRGRVAWTTAEALLETSKHWDEWLKRDNVRFFSGAGMTLNLFTGSDFNAFTKPGLRLIPMGLTAQKLGGSHWGLEVAYDVRLLNIHPREFALPPNDTFGGGTEWIGGAYFAVLYSR